MSNVRKEMGRSRVPTELEMPGMTGAVKKPPNTIDDELRGASGKAGMNFKHKPLGPETHYEDGEQIDVAREEDKGSVMGGKIGIKGSAGSKKMSTGAHKGGTRRSTSGAQGHGIIGN